MDVKASFDSFSQNQRKKEKKKISRSKHSAVTKIIAKAKSSAFESVSRRASWLRVCLVTANSSPCESSNPSLSFLFLSYYVIHYCAGILRPTERKKGRLQPVETKKRKKRNIVGRKDCHLFYRLTFFIWFIAH